jgi:hypothetical protein
MVPSRGQFDPAVSHHRFFVETMTAVSSKMANACSNLAAASNTEPIQE